MQIKRIIFLKAVLILAVSFYCQHALLKKVDGGLFDGTPIRYIEHIVGASRRHGVNPALIAAVIAVESNFKPNAKSYAGAKGLMQINDVTARYLRVKNIYDPEVNIHAGVGYLSELSEMFDGRIELILAAYNAGPGAVKRFKGVPPYKQTRKYIQKVMELFHIYKSHPDLTDYI